MKNKILCIISMLCLTTALFGQKQANHWFIGWDGGTHMDFNVSSPAASDIAGVWPDNFESQRASASISDKSGLLLFYTNGLNIWDKNEDLMPNGGKLDGGHSVSQGALIVPLPGSTSIYYVFILSPSGFTPNDLLLSIVDMSLNGGLGDVKPGAKNLFCKATSLCEKLTAVRHKNGTDIWIIVHESGSNKFLSFLLTPAGWTTSTIPTPVKSYSGTVYNNLDGGGCMNPSNDGSKIVSANGYGLSFSMWEMYDFDNATGILSNPFTIPAPSGQETYDTEFSPNDSVLYGSSSVGTFQWNLAAGSSAAILASQVLLPSSATGHIQLAPNGKIYGVVHESGGFIKKLDVINNPNGFGGPNNCNYISKGFLTTKGLPCGLPNIPLNIFPKLDFNSTSVCLGDSTQFTLIANKTYDSVRWYFDNPTSGADNTSTLSNPKHLYFSPGDYNVKLIVVSNMGTKKDTIKHSVKVFSKPYFNLSKDTSICQGNTFLLNASHSKGGTWNFLWHDMTIDSTHIAMLPATYSVTITDTNGCKSSSSIKVSNFPIPSLGNDTAICAGTTLLLNAGVNDPGTTYIWNDNSAGAAYVVAESGAYWVKDNICNNYDSINIILKDCETILTMPNIFSPNNDGSNDSFNAVIAKGITQMQSTIYNRWGIEVYSSNNPMVGWDGKTQKGKDADEGTYFFIINYTGIDGNATIEKGTVQIIR